MKQPTKQQRQENKEKAAIKNFRYNRFLMLRYLLTVFFFANAYWFLGLLLGKSMMLFLPLILLVSIIPAFAEHVKLYSNNQGTPVLVWNKRYNTAQLTVNGLMIVALLTEFGSHLFFPFLETNWTIRISMIAFLMCGMLISAICNTRIAKIKGNNDKHYKLIGEFEKSMH